MFWCPWRRRGDSRDGWFTAAVKTWNVRQTHAGRKKVLLFHAASGQRLAYGALVEKAST